MVKHSGDHSRHSYLSNSLARSPTHAAGSSSSSPRAAANATKQPFGATGAGCSSPLDPSSGKLDIARWAAAAAEQLQDGSAPAHSSGAPPRQPSAGNKPGLSPRDRGACGIPPRATSPQARRTVGVGSVLAQQQQQHSGRSTPASPSGAARAPPQPGSQQRAGAFSPLFSGGGMWSAQGKAAPDGSGAGWPAEQQQELAGRSMAPGSTASSTLTASSYQAAAKAAAAAIVAQKQGRPMSPDRSRLSGLEQQFVAAAATAAASRMMGSNRAPSPMLQRPGYEAAPVPPRRSISPGPPSRMVTADMLASGRASPRALVNADLEARLSAYARQLTPEAIAACPPLLRERLQQAYEANQAADAAAAAAAAHAAALQPGLVPAHEGGVPAGMLLQQHAADALMQEQHARMQLQHQQQQQSFVRSYPTALSGTPSPEPGAPGSYHSSRRGSPDGMWAQQQQQHYTTHSVHSSMHLQPVQGSDAGCDIAAAAAGLSIVRGGSRPGSAQGILHPSQQQHVRPGSSCSYTERLEEQLLRSRRPGSRCSTDAADRYSPEPGAEPAAEGLPRPLSIRVRPSAAAPAIGRLDSMSDVESSLAGASHVLSGRMPAHGDTASRASSALAAGSHASKYQPYSGQAGLAYTPGKASRAGSAAPYLHGDVSRSSLHDPEAGSEACGGGGDMSEGGLTHHTNQQRTQGRQLQRLEQITVTRESSSHNKGRRASSDSDSDDGSASWARGGGSGGKAAASNAGGKHPGSKPRICVQVDASKDDARGCASCCRGRVVKCVVLPLLLLVIAGAGVGAGVWFAMRSKSGTASPAAAPGSAGSARALFGVTAHPALPGVAADQRCKMWFGTPERLASYHHAFAGAYTQGLALAPGAITVTSITCDGRAVWEQPPPAGGRPPAARLLLAATGAAASQQAPPPGASSEVITKFVITASAGDSAGYASLAGRVASLAADMLTAPLAQFYRTSVWVEQAGQLDDWQPVGASAAAAAPTAAAIAQPAAAAAAATAPGKQPAASAAAATPVSTATASDAAAAKPAGGKKGGKGKGKKNKQHNAAAATASTAATKAPPAPAPAPADDAAATEAAAEEPAEPVVEGPQAAPITLSGEAVTVVNRIPAGKAGKAKKQQAPAPVPAEAAAMDGDGTIGTTAGGEPDEDADYHLEPMPAGKGSASKSAPQEPLEPYADDDGTGTSAGTDSAADALDPSEEPIEPPPPAASSSSAPGGSSEDGSQWVEFYDNAPTCTAVPTIANSVYDGSGRLWGFEKAAMCVFRATSPQWAPVTWKEAPACTGTPSASNAVYDESGKLWSWQGGRNCAFRGAAAKPAAAKWEAAPACAGLPSASNSVKDVNGHKWGWVSAAKTCAFRAKTA